VNGSLPLERPGGVVCPRSEVVSARLTATKNFISGKTPANSRTCNGLPGYRTRLACNASPARTFGISPKQSLQRSPRLRDAIANTRDACATLNAYAPQRASPARRRNHLSSITGHNPSDPAVTALSFREIVDRRKQIFAREIRPQL
jgi:hypothetical protein